MKRLLAAAALLAPIWLLPDLNCSKTAVAPRSAAPKIAEATPAPDLFASTVRPILLEQCAPCHEPGGVMYEKLPFDHPEVIASHSTGVLKRIKTPEERAAIERWLATQRS